MYVCMYVCMYYYVPFSLGMVLFTDKFACDNIQKAIAMFDHNINSTNGTSMYVHIYHSFYHYKPL